jgi:endonuclease/exonuclease/phosphatase (EEP) superfamily protein YafD
MNEPASKHVPVRAEDSSSVFRLRISLAGLLTAAATLTACASIVGFFGSVHWSADLCSHFRLQYSVALGGAAALLAPFRGHRVSAALIALFAAVNLVPVIPYYISAPPSPDPSAKTPYRALLVNVHTRLGDASSVAKLIGDEDPDILVLEEVTEEWLQQLEPVLSGYAHRIEEPRDDNFGIALFSKLPVISEEIRECGAAAVPSILAEFASGGSRFAVLATHPVPPTSEAYSRWRNEQLAELPKWIAEQQSAVVLLGDLNVTPWSPHFARLLRKSGLRDSARGRGVVGTWPAFLPFLRIPIDHCLHSAGIEIVDRRRGAQTGSDHFPLIVDFVISTEK